jgi:hypothetical protein
MGWRMKTIELTRDKFALVDDEDYDYLNQWNWYCDSNGYATRQENSIRIYMHRIIAKTPKGMFTDHLNGNRQDNRKSNLRVVTHHQNNLNKIKGKKWTSIYKGVNHKSASHRGKPWVANIKYKGKTRGIGSFDNEHHAALAYDLWATYLYGKFANTNFVVV